MAVTESFEYRQTVNNGYVVSYTEKEDTETFEIKKKKLSLRSSDGVEIVIDGKAIRLQVDDKSILELTSDGMTYNGESLAFGALVDLINDYKSSLVLTASPGSPSPLFPAMATQIATNLKWKPNIKTSLTTKK